MKILLSWLQEFVSLPLEPRQLAGDLTTLGLPVDSVTTEEGETVFDLDITTNRPDCLSHYGVARELGALYGKPVAGFEETTPGKARRRKKSSVVEIADPDLCRRYSARLIRDLTVAPSPAWLSRRLERVGVRSINNVADATNYVLMAYGQPLHAFDLDRLDGQKIIVRRAADGEIVRTLDAMERRLCSQDLVIADATRAVALAGVMGGLDTEISPRTRNVLLESAWFDPVAVRRTSKRQALHTEASHRFERGTDIGATVMAATRCIELIQELAGGTVDPHGVDVFPDLPAPQRILLRASELERHLGIEIPSSEVETILSQLGFSPRARARSGWLCTVPGHRVDVSREIDLVEEVARHYGYDRFPLRLPALAGQAARRAPHAAKEECLRSLLLALGYDEALSSILVSRETERFGEWEPVPLANPLSEESAVLRTSLVPGLLAAIQWNLYRGQETVRLFEMGSLYRQEEKSYQEPATLALAATGDRVEANFGRPPRRFDFFDLKGDLEQIVESFEIGPYSFDSEGVPDFYRPGHRAQITVAGNTVGRWGQLRPEVAERWKFRQPVYLAEVNLDLLYRSSLRSPKVQPISRFPAVERDFSVVLAEGTRFEAVREAVVSLGIAELVAVEPVEIFRGSPVPAGRYSLLLRVTFQSQQATLAEEQLTRHSARIIETLANKLGAQIRVGA